MFHLVSTTDVFVNAAPIHAASRCAYRLLYSRLIRSRIEDQNVRHVVINVVEITAPGSGKMKKPTWRRQEDARTSTRTARSSMQIYPSIITSYGASSAFSGDAILTRNERSQTIPACIQRTRHRINNMAMAILDSYGHT